MQQDIYTEQIGFVSENVIFNAFQCHYEHQCAPALVPEFLHLLNVGGLFWKCFQDLLLKILYDNWILKILNQKKSHWDGLHNKVQLGQRESKIKIINSVTSLLLETIKDIPFFLLGSCSANEWYSMVWLWFDKFRKGNKL